MGILVQSCRSQLCKSDACSAESGRSYSRLLIYGNRPRAATEEIFYLCPKQTVKQVFLKRSNEYLCVIQVYIFHY